MVSRFPRGSRKWPGPLEHGMHASPDVCSTASERQTEGGYLAQLLAPARAASATTVHWVHCCLHAPRHRRKRWKKES